MYRLGWYATRPSVERTEEEAFTLRCPEGNANTAEIRGEAPALTSVQFCVLYSLVAWQARSKQLVAPQRHRMIGKWVPAQTVERRVGSRWRRKETTKFQEEEGQTDTEGRNETRK